MTQTQTPIPTPEKVERERRIIGAALDNPRRFRMFASGGIDCDTFTDPVRRFLWGVLAEVERGQVASHLVDVGSILADVLQSLEGTPEIHEARACLESARRGAV
jgi:hypothetical protein